MSIIATIMAFLTLEQPDGEVHKVELSGSKEAPVELVDIGVASVSLDQEGGSDPGGTLLRRLIEQSLAYDIALQSVELEFELEAEDRRPEAQRVASRIGNDLGFSDCPLAAR